jgi:hypothetical protein
MNYTTVEQSKKLLELGLNPESADMWWTPLNWQLTEYYVEVKQDGIGTPKNPLPCWSLGALLKLMPKTISVPVDERSAYFYDLEWQFANDNSLRYIPTNRGKCLIDIYSDHDIGRKSFIETTFEMMVWLLENGYIKTENKND